jgi:hypothetical protein
MITDIAVERVEFRCPEGHWESCVDYDVVLYVDAEGDTWEFYSVDGVPTPSPYYIDGAPFCPVCHRAVRGRPAARRVIPVPPGAPGTPRRWVATSTDAGQEPATATVANRSPRQPNDATRETPRS